MLLQQRRLERKEYQVARRRQQWRSLHPKARFCPKMSSISLVMTVKERTVKAPREGRGGWTEARPSMNNLRGSDPEEKEGQEHCAEGLGPARRTCGTGRLPDRIAGLRCGTKDACGRASCCGRCTPGGPYQAGWCPGRRRLLSTRGTIPRSAAQMPLTAGAGERAWEWREPEEGLPNADCWRGAEPEAGVLVDGTVA